MEFFIKRWSWVVPLLVPLGGTRAGSVLTLTDGALKVRMGFFRTEIPYANIRVAEAFTWPWWAVALGWRTNLHDKIALLGSMNNAVKLTLYPRVPMRLLVPMKVAEFYVSLEEPEAFLKALKDKLPASTATARVGKGETS